MLKKLFAPIDLTKGKIYQVILVFMAPIFLSYIFQQVYTLTDAIIVGQNLSASEVNGVNDVGSLTYIVLQFAYGCAAGFSVVSSASQGNKDLDGVRKSFLVQIILSLIISIILTILAVSLIDPMLSLVGLNAATGGSTYQAAKTYIFIIFLGTICQVAYNQICSLLRSIGDSVTPLLFLIASTILNIVLDIVFIVNCNWGVAGAAFATILAQGISALLCYIYTFIKYPYLRFKKEDFKINWKFYGEHLKLGLPLAFQFSILAIGLITLQSTIIKFDTTAAGIVIENGPAQLAYGAANKVSTFLMTPLNALGTAMLSYCGQNYGAKEYKRVKKGILTAIVIMFIIYFIDLAIALLLLIDDAYLKLFYAADSITEKTSYLGRINIFCTIPFFPLVGTLYILRCSIQGFEKPIVPFCAGIGELLARTLLCLFGPLIFVASINTSIDLYANPGSYIITCLADPFAWLIATTILSVGYLIVIYLPIRKAEKNEKEKVLIKQPSENIENTDTNNKQKTL